MAWKLISNGQQQSEEAQPQKRVWKRITPVQPAEPVEEPSTWEKIKSAGKGFAEGVAGVTKGLVEKYGEWATGMEQKQKAIQEAPTPEAKSEARKELAKGYVGGITQAPKVISEFVAPASTEFVKTVGGVIGEGADYYISRASDYLFGDPDKPIKPLTEENYPTLFKTTQGDIARKTAGAMLEGTIFKYVPNTAKMGLLQRAGVGGVQGIAFAVSEGLAKGLTPEETIENMKNYGYWGAGMEVIFPYLLPLWKLQKTEIVNQFKKDITLGLKKKAPEEAAVVAEKALPGAVEEAFTPETAAVKPPTVKRVPLSIVEPEELKFTVNPNNPKIKQYIEQYKAGVEVPPIPVYQEGNRLILNKDGYNRYFAAKYAELKDILVDIQEKTKLTPYGKQLEERAKYPGPKSKPEISVAPKTTKPNPLIQEARKYKSAEEFVKAQEKNILYHGTRNEYAWKIDKHGFKVPKDSPGVSLSDDFDMAASYTDEISGRYSNNDVFSVVPKRGAKPVLVGDGTEALTGEYIYKPEDLIIVGRGKKTKSQLTDIWKEANKSQPLQEGGNTRAEKAAAFGRALAGEKKASWEKKYGQTEAEVKAETAKIAEALGAKKAEPTAPKEGLPPSRIAKRIEAAAIEQNLTTGFETLAGYEKINIKNLSERVSKLINESFEDARAMVNAEKDLPEGMPGMALIEGMARYLKKNPDERLAFELANSPLVSGTSKAAQTLRVAAELDQDTAPKIFSKIANDLRGRIKPEKIKETVDRIVRETKPRLKLKSAQELLDKLIC